MMLVKVRVAPSAHGLGIFAIDKIPQGTPIWRFHKGWDLMFTENEWLALEENVRANIMHYVYKAKNGYYVFCTDDARFFNHNENPNTGPIEMDPNWTAEEKRKNYCEIAYKDIEPGEELTCDYQTYEDEAWFKAREIK